MNNTKQFFLAVMAILSLAACSSKPHYVQTPPQPEPKQYVGYAAEVFSLKGKTIILLPTDVVFDQGTSEFKDKSEDLLNQALAILKQHSKDNIHIRVGTDPVEGQAQNDKLSTERAAQVAGYFWSSGIMPGKTQRHLTFSGEGQLSPIATNQNLVGMAINRRIEIVIYPRGTHYYFNERPEAKVYQW